MDGFVRKLRNFQRREDCMASCLAARTFSCRSVNFNIKTGDCTLSDMDRHTVSSTSSAFVPDEDYDYMENNCAEDPVSKCQFRATHGRILKTVDSVYQNVPTLDACKDKCVRANYRCHSYDYGDTGAQVCRLSHHSTSTLLLIDEPYLEASGATTYELGACYNVTVECKNTYMVARVRTNRVFSGKMYGKSRPNSCTVDVEKSLDFQLFLGYNDINCDVRQDDAGKFASDVIIQHHDTIVTSNDVGLKIKCNYNLSNKTVSHNTDLEVNGGLSEAGYEQTIVQAPNVTMRITDRQGEDINSAKVGDRLALRFEIQDSESPYEIFVRELVASDGLDNSEILLVDSIGCPTDYSIMAVLQEVGGSGQTLQANFEAFKFPTSSVVQFRALVTPCIPRCDPVKCDVTDYHGTSRTLSSFGKRRKKRSSEKQNNDEDVMVAGVIHISDQFELGDKNSDKSQQPSSDWNDCEVNPQGRSASPEEGVSLFAVAMGATLFLIAQSILIAAWTFLYHKSKKRTDMAKNSVEQHQVLPDYDPYLTDIFRRRSACTTEFSSNSSPETSLECSSINSDKQVNHSRHILTHLDKRKP